MRDLGCVEGRNVVNEGRFYGDTIEQLPAHAAELVRLQLDVIVAPATPAALAAKDATKTIPIVFATAGDPVGSGLVAGIVRPSGGVTGISLLAPEIVARQLRLLREAVPKASRVAVLSNPAHRNTARLVKETEAAARSRTNRQTDPCVGPGRTASSHTCDRARARHSPPPLAAPRAGSARR